MSSFFVSGLFIAEFQCIQSGIVVVVILVPKDFGQPSNKVISYTIKNNLPFVFINLSGSSQNKELTFHF